MAPTRRIDEIGSGIPFEEIYSTVFSKSFILPGMAEMNIAEIDNLEKKSKKDLILLFFKKEFFIILLILLFGFISISPKTRYLVSITLKEISSFLLWTVKYEDREKLDHR